MLRNLARPVQMTGKLQLLRLNWSDLHLKIDS